MNTRKRIGIPLAAAAALGLTLGTAVAADVVKSGDPATMPDWYGRAGGLVGSQRVIELSAHLGGKQVGITFDRDVAKRTNMPRDAVSEGPLTATVDRQVAERTNMPGG